VKFEHLSVAGYVQERWITVYDLIGALHSHLDKFRAFVQDSIEVNKVYIQAEALKASGEAPWNKILPSSGDFTSFDECRACFHLLPPPPDSDGLEGVAFVV
jgi:hypothetical protein